MSLKKANMIFNHSRWDFHYVHERLTEHNTLSVHLHMTASTQNNNNKETSEVKSLSSHLHIRYDTQHLLHTKACDINLCSYTF